MNLKGDSVDIYLKFPYHSHLVFELKVNRTPLYLILEDTRYLSISSESKLFRLNGHFPITGPFITIMTYIVI